VLPAAVKKQPVTTSPDTSESTAFERRFSNLN